MNTLMLMTGVDIPIPELQTAIHQPTIIEISYIGETEYFSVISTLCFNKQQLMIQQAQDSFNLASMSNFQIFMTMINDAKAVKKEDLLSVFTLLFPGYIAQFLPHSILFINTTTQKSFHLEETNFEVFQNVIREIACYNHKNKNSELDYNPVDEKAAAIAAKLLKGRARAAELKGETSGNILSKYVSILTIGLQSMSLFDCLNLTVYQLYDLIERYGLYISWDLDIKSRLAGGKPDSKPDDWMKNIH